MQSGKFFSNDVLRELGVLNEDSRVNEAPLGMAAGLTTRLGTMMPGQSTRAKAKGKLETGKVANNLYQNYYQWLGRNNQQPTEQSIIDFLIANKMPTENAKSALTQYQTAPKQPAQTPSKQPSPVQKGQFSAPAQAKTSPTNNPPAGPEQSPTVSQATQVTNDVRKALGTTMEESLYDILKLSGLSEIITEQLSRKAISAAFRAAAGEFLDKGYTELPPAASASGKTPSAASASGKTPAAATSASGSSSSSSGIGSVAASNDPIAEFKSWLEKNKDNTTILNTAKKELERAINKPAVQPQSQASASQTSTPLVRTNPAATTS